jgi:hypothetical protein
VTSNYRRLWKRNRSKGKEEKGSAGEEGKKTSSRHVPEIGTQKMKANQ